MRSRLVALFLLHPFGGAFFSVSPNRPDIKDSLVRNLNLWANEVIEVESRKVTTPIPTPLGSSGKGRTSAC